MQQRTLPEMTIIDPLLTPQGVQMAQQHQEAFLEHSAFRFGAFEIFMCLVALFSSLFLFWGLQLLTGILLIKRPSFLLSEEQRKYWEQLNALKRKQWEEYKKNPQMRLQMKHNGFLFCSFASIGIAMILGFSFLDSHRSEQKLQGATLRLEQLGLGALYTSLQLGTNNALLDAKGEPVGSWSATPNRINLHFEKHPGLLKKKQISGKELQPVSTMRTLQLRPTPTFEQWVALEQQVNFGLFYPKSNLPNYETVRASLIVPETTPSNSSFSGPRYD